MQTYKKFVRYTHLNDTTPLHSRDTKKNYKKNYSEKTYKGQAIKPLLNMFVACAPSQKVQQLIIKWPKFFNQISKNPEKQKNENLNQYLISNIVKRNQQLKVIQNQSDDELNWDTGSQDQFKLESKPINQQIVARMSTKLAGLTCKKNEQLKKHEKQFLDDYYRTKKKNEEQKKNGDSQKDQKVIKTEIQKSETKIQQNIKEPEKNNQFDAWRNPSNQSNCWIEKIEQYKPQSDDLQVGDDDDDDGMWNDESEDEKPLSTPSDQDDAFVDDQKPTTKNKVNIVYNTNQIKANQGVVHIYLFANIAQKIGLAPLSCKWFIKNKRQKYKVNTNYMDTIYRQQNVCVQYPYVALEDSEFIHNADINLQNYQLFKKKSNMFNPQGIRNQEANKNQKKTHKKTKRTHRNL